MKVLALAILLIGQSAFATQLFYCQHRTSSSQLTLEVLEVGGKVFAEMDWVTGSSTENVKMEVLSANDAQKNGYSAALAKHLNVNWKKVSFVTIYDAGDYSDDAAGAVGVTFVDKNGDVYKQGMHFGWAGMLTCR